MQQEAFQEDVKCSPPFRAEEEAMLQGDNNIEAGPTMMDDWEDNNAVPNSSTDKTNIAPIDVNGGIDDDDLLAIMTSKVKAMHPNTTEDTSLTGPNNGTNKEQC